MNFKPLRNWPHISRNPEDISKLTGGVYGVDAEWDIRYNRPTVLGLSDGNRTVCVPWGQGRGYFSTLAGKERSVWVLHNGLQADLPVFMGEGVALSSDTVEDTIIWHWLTSPNLCKTQNKTSEDGTEKRGAGFLNLYAMCSIYTDAPNWKACRGDLCEGPCPEHDVFGYCGNDAYWPMVALPHMKKIAQLRGVDKLYPLHRNLSVVLSEMTERGVLVDVKYIETLRGEFDAAKQSIRASLSFNPESPKQVIAKFPRLSDTTEESIRDAVEESSDPELQTLLDYKELGDGPDRWFAPKVWKKKDWEGYVDESGRVHPRFNCFTSSGRLASAGPNFQNVAKRRLDRHTGENVGKRIRKAVIAPDGYQLVEADYKNAEGCVILWEAGYDLADVPKDFHGWMQELCGIGPSDPFALALGGPKDASKSVTHASNYMEGLQLKTREELRKPVALAEIAAGARLVYEDWTFKDKIVTFTGANLARRAFGDASRENRRKALDIQVRYIERAFPKIRQLQRKITKEIERERMIKPPSGLFIPSYGYDEDRIKTAVAVYGQQPVAHLTKLALCLSKQQTELIPVLQVHDSLLFYAPLSMPPKQIRQWIEGLMCVEDLEMPGLKLRVDIKVGMNWCDMVQLAA